MAESTFCHLGVISGPKFLPPSVEDANNLQQLLLHCTIEKTRILWLALLLILKESKKHYLYILSVQAPAIFVYQWQYPRREFPPKSDKFCKRHSLCKSQTPLLLSLITNVCTASAPIDKLKSRLSSEMPSQTLSREMYQLVICLLLNGTRLHPSLGTTSIASVILKDVEMDEKWYETDLQRRERYQSRYEQICAYFSSSLCV